MSAVSVYLMLFFAIICEVVATFSLRFSEGFTKILPTSIVIIGYGIAFYLLSITVKFIPIGIAYAIWSGVGIICITLLGWLFLKQHLDLAGMIGIALIMIGVIVINVFSASAPH